MSNRLKMLSYALKEHANNTGINFVNLNKNIKYFANDGRYKIFPLACTCVDNFRQSGIFRYRGNKYYYQQTENTVTVDYCNK